MPTRGVFTHLRRCLAIVLLVGLTLPMMPARSASPRTFTVCASGCDFTTIQAALDDDRLSVGDTIQVTDAVHTEAGITFCKDVTVQGQGAARTIVQAHTDAANAPDRVFLVEAGTTVVIRDITIRHGKPAKGEHGGGILNFGTLTVENCVITNNTANGGGGICSRDTAVLTVVNSTIRDNHANGIASRGLECGNGGGILCGGGEMTLEGSTVSGNQAGLPNKVSRSRGGGVHVGCNCTAMFVNSTISGNQSIDQGGGVALWGALRLANCTISDNTASGIGGGIYIRGPLDITNTIIAHNDGKQGDCFLAPGDSGGRGSIGENEHNLVEDRSCDAAYSGDPLLGPLADNGGATWTHALLPGSPAIDVVPAQESTLTTDQRGLPRPVACASSDTPVDLGAFEVQAGEYVAVTPGPSPTPVSPTPTATPTMPPPEAQAPTAVSGILLPLGIGLLLLGLVAAVVLWLRRRGR